MNVKQVMAELKSLGSEQTVKIYRNHGATGDMYGVKIADLKKVIRKVKGDQELAMELWDTGNSDAMYMAGLLADGNKMTKTQLNKWAKTAWWYMLSEHSVPGAASEHKDAVGLANKWMTSKNEHIATSGWCTYSAVISTFPDEALDLDEIKTLLKEVESKVHDAPNRVGHCMNGFVISTGTYVSPLLRAAKATAKKIGKVTVDVGNTSCKVPLATEYIAKVESMGRVGKKRKTAKC